VRLRVFVLFFSCSVFGSISSSPRMHLYNLTLQASTSNGITASRRWQLFGCQAAGDHHLSWHAPSAPSPRCSDWKAINNHYDRCFWLYSHPTGSPKSPCVRANHMIRQRPQRCAEFPHTTPKNGLTPLSKENSEYKSSTSHSILL